MGNFKRSCWEIWQCDHFSDTSVGIFDQEERDIADLPTYDGFTDAAIKATALVVEQRMERYAVAKAEAASEEEEDPPVLDATSSSNTDRPAAREGQSENDCSAWRYMHNLGSPRHCKLCKLGPCQYGLGSASEEVEND
jgi:hypothetical protein